MTGVPEISDEAVTIRGPMGRAYAILPCGHHSVNFPDPYTGTLFHERTCRACGIRYDVGLLADEHGCRAVFVRRT